VYTVDVNRWLSRYEDDFDVCRELALSKPGVQQLPRTENVLHFALKVQSSTNE